MTALASPDRSASDVLFQRRSVQPPICRTSWRGTWACAKGRVTGPVHPEVGAGADLGNLAAILRDLGEPAAARPLAERAAAIDKAYDPDPL